MPGFHGVGWKNRETVSDNVWEQVLKKKHIPGSQLASELLFELRHFHFTFVCSPTFSQSQLFELWTTHATGCIFRTQHTGCSESERGQCTFINSNEEAVLTQCKWCLVQRSPFAHTNKRMSALKSAICAAEVPSGSSWGKKFSHSPLERWPRASLKATAVLHASKHGLYSRRDMKQMEALEKCNDTSMLKGTWDRYPSQRA